MVARTVVAATVVVAAVVVAKVVVVATVVVVAMVVVTGVVGATVEAATVDGDATHMHIGQPALSAIVTKVAPGLQRHAGYVGHTGAVVVVAAVMVVVVEIVEEDVSGVRVGDDVITSGDDVGSMGAGPDTGARVGGS